jgi:hypothetical protein
LSFGNVGIFKAWYTEVFGTNVLTGSLGTKDPILIDVDLEDSKIVFYPGKNYNLSTSTSTTSVTCTFTLKRIDLLRHALSASSLVNLPTPLGEYLEDSTSIVLKGASSADGIGSRAIGYSSYADGNYSLSLGHQDKVTGT